MAEGVPWNEDSGRNEVQRAMADILVTTLGRAGAINACWGNAWYGVLELILDNNDDAQRR